MGWMPHACQLQRSTGKPLELAGHQYGRPWAQLLELRRAGGEPGHYSRATRSNPNIVDKAGL